MESNEPEGLGSSPGSVSNSLQELGSPPSTCPGSSLTSIKWRDYTRWFTWARAAQRLQTNCAEKLWERGPGTLFCSFPRKSYIFPRLINDITEISDSIPNNFKAVLDTTLFIYPAIFVAVFVSLFFHLPIHSRYKHSLSTFSMYGWKKTHQKLTDWLKKQGTMLRRFWKSIFLSSAILTTFLVLLKRLPRLPFAYRMKSKQLSLFSNPSVIWLLSHLLSTAFIQQHLLSINHIPDTVLEYWNAMLSDKDLGLAHLELTGINQMITLIQNEAFP